MIVKTQRGMEYIAASYIKEKLGVEVEVRPNGFLGLLIVHSKDEEALKDVPEIESVVPAQFMCKADIEEILSLAEKVAELVKGAKTFAVRTKRRGKHNFTSLDVNLKFGEKIRKLSDAEVDLDFPEKAVYVEIIGERAFLGVIEGSRERKKYRPEKFNSLKLLSKISIVQLPYLEDEKAAYEIGERIGRAAQTFEVKELIISPFGYINAFELERFLKGVREGQRVRYEIQRKAYSREVKLVPVLVQDLYQTVRDKRRKKNVLIATDPTGKQILDVKDQILKSGTYADEIVIFIGSRVGVPKGVFKFCDFVLDLAPYVTFATEHTIPATVIALLTIFEEVVE